MHINSNEVSSQNQLAAGGVTHKFYIYVQILQFYQCETNLTFITPKLIAPDIHHSQVKISIGDEFFSNPCWKWVNQLLAGICIKKMTKVWARLEQSELDLSIFQAIVLAGTSFRFSQLRCHWIWLGSEFNCDSYHRVTH